MSYKEGDQFVIEIEKSFNGELFQIKNDDRHIFTKMDLDSFQKVSAGGEKVEIWTVEPGSVVLIGGNPYEVLDTDVNDIAGDRGVFVLSKDILFQAPFDEDNCNDWRESSLRKKLNGEWLIELKDLIGGENILPFERDLTSEDGLHDYGTCEDFVSLISCDEYRKYHEKCIKNKSDWWWTLTPYSTPNASSSSSARLVFTDGSLYYYNAFYGGYGVSPALLALPSLLVEVVEGKRDDEE